MLKEYCKTTTIRIQYFFLTCHLERAHGYFSMCTIQVQLRDLIPMEMMLLLKVSSLLDKVICTQLIILQSRRDDNRERRDKG